MAKNRKNQAAAIHFGTVFKVVLLCTLIGGSAIGYVWQKGEIAHLGRQISDHEKQLAQLKSDNRMLADQLAAMRSPVMLDQRVRELKLGLAPAQPGQKILLAEPVSTASDKNAQPQQFASRPTVELTP
jgi:cell division protein FtsB